MATTIHTHDLCSILSESKKIINTHSRHFLALSILFLLPLSFFVIALLTFLYTLTNSKTNQTLILLRYTDPHLINIKPFVVSIIFSITTWILSTCATGTITYSVFHGFYGRPIDLASAIKSLSKSFWRLFATMICYQIILSGVSGLSTLILVLAVRGIEFLGFHVLSSIVYAIGLFVSLFVLLNLQVKWSLAYVVVVVELSWGLEPLRRSSYLVKEMRRVSVSLMVFFGSATGLIVFAGWQMLGFSVIDWKSLTFLVNIFEISALYMILLLYSFAANTVLYIYSKASHGEIAEEYVSLPFDDEKVPPSC